MQLYLHEGVTQHELERFSHQTLAFVRAKSVIPEIAAVKESANDLVDVDHADDRIVINAPNQEAGVVFTTRSFQICIEHLGHRSAWRSTIDAAVCFCFPLQETRPDLVRSVRRCTRSGPSPPREPSLLLLDFLPIILRDAA